MKNEDHQWLKLFEIECEVRIFIRDDGSDNQHSTKIYNIVAIDFDDAYNSIKRFEEFNSNGRRLNAVTDIINIKTIKKVMIFN